MSGGFLIRRVCGIGICVWCIKCWLWREGVESVVGGSFRGSRIGVGVRRGVGGIVSWILNNFVISRWGGNF